MGMRVGGGGGASAALVEKLIEAERLPIKQLEVRKQEVVEQQKAFKELTGLVSALGTTLGGFRTRGDFYKLKLESSHPDIIDGSVTYEAPVGAYELEVLQMAKSYKLLTQGFPDKDETPVGFGYMRLDMDDGTSFDLDIDPDNNTLEQVSQQINDAKLGVKAFVLNTKEHIEDDEADDFRLLVISEKTGKHGRIYIDPDMSYMDFAEQVTGKNLEVLFEDVPIYEDNNTIKSLLPGLTLNAKRAEPGTKITLKIDYDVEKTSEAIKTFVENYNKLNIFLDKQFQVDPQTNKAGLLAHDNTLRALRRALQSPVQFQSSGGTVYKNLASIGITTDPKTGSLKLDEATLKKTLGEDYVSVANLFIQTDTEAGFGSRMSDAIRGVQNIQSGFIGSKEREFKRLLTSFDTSIVQKERMVAQKAETIRRRFANLDQLMSGLNTQSQYLQARLGSLSQSEMPAPGPSKS